VLTPVGSTRSYDFVADEPGDWALHCHMTHHVMNQMGHGLPNTTGLEAGDLDKRIRKLVPGYMTMGQAGMGDMAEMGMKNPRNSIPMVGGEGPFGYITMGGMFTIFKVREGITSYDDPGWYKHPVGTVAVVASAEELRRDGVELPKDLPQAALLKNGELWCGVPPKNSGLLAQNTVTARIKVN
jgi:manganese oxidase